LIMNIDSRVDFSRKIMGLSLLKLMFSYKSRN